MANNTVHIIANTIPPPYGSQMEEAVKAGIGDLPGQWRVTLMADQKSLAYYVVLRNGDAPPLQWKFEDPYEEQPAVVTKWIWNGLRGTLKQTLREKREKILQTARRYGASHVRIFGSRARGEPAPGSDLDVLVRMDLARSLFDLIGLQQEIQELVGFKVDVVTEDGLRPHVRQRVLKEAIEL